MSDINQIQMSFNPKEDRILFRMNTHDSSGFQFWLTRRYVKLLWPILHNLISKDEQITSQTSEIAKKEVMSFQQQEATRKMDLSKKFESQMSQQPLGDSPILLAKVTIKKRADGVQLLCMHPESGSGIDLALNKTILHTICKLLQDTIEKSNWELSIMLNLRSESVFQSSQNRVLN